MKKIFYSMIALATLSLVSCNSEEEKTTEGTEEHKTEAPAPISGTYNTKEGSVITWKAKHYKDADYVHVGTVPVEGNIIVDNNQIVGGEFTVDILNLDEDGDTEYNQMLEGHLKSADIFNVVEYPTAKITITGSEDGKILGTLDVLGVTQDVVLEGNINISEEEATIEGASTFDMLVYNTPYFTQSESAPEEEKGDSADPQVAVDVHLELVK